MVSDDETLSSRRRLSLGERAAVGRIAESLFGEAAEPIRFGRYRVVERIGAGAFGRVYRVRDPELDRDIALKLLHASANAERIVEEARAMAAISHPNVVTVFDVGVVDEAQAFIAMQLVDGADLRRWLQRGPPRQRVIDVLVQAGRGLAAAHHAGLVHGDFKPDNVLVEDAQAGPIARVVDFGLARSPAEVTSRGDELATATSPRLRGTPAYMAPEQLGGRAPDRLSDQFAFFVTVYEALHGERPFEGATPIAVAAAITSGERKAIDPALPGAVRTAIARGLAPDPAERFSSIDAALAAMRQRGRGRAVVTAACVVALAGGGAAWVLASERPPAIEGCAGSSERLWSLDTQSRGAKAFAASPLPYAAQAWTRAQSRLDDWASRWSTAHDDACAAIDDAGVEPRRQRVACLDEQRIAFTSVVDHLVAAAPETVRVTAEIVEALPDPGQCESPRTAVASFADQASIAAAVERARILYMIGDDDGARRVAADAEVQAAALADPRLLARARGWLALVALRGPDRSAGLEQTREAFAAAAAAGDASFAGFLALSLATAEGYEARDPDAGQKWIREAETLIERAGRPPPLVARLHSVKAAREQVRGDLRAARDEAALAVQTLEAWDPTSVGLVDARANVGVLAQLAGDTPAAIEALDAALLQAHAQLGPRHPVVGPIASNQVLPLITLGRYRDAERRGAEALAIIGSADTDVLQNIGIALQLQGRADLARERYQDALQIVTEQHGNDDPRVGQVLVNLADLDARYGRLDDAVAEIKRARTVLDAALPEAHPARAIVYATETLVHRMRDELPAALERGGAAHAIAVAAGDAVLRATVELEYGEALLAADDPRARAVLESSVALAAAADDPRLHARVLFALARASPDANALARDALTRFPPEGDPAEREAIRVWLAR